MPSPNRGYPYLEEAQAHKEVTINDLVDMLDTDIGSLIGAGAYAPIAEDALLFTVVIAAGGTKYLYADLTGITDYTPVAAGDFLEYELMTTSPADIEIGMDIGFSDATYARATTGWLDQRGFAWANPPMGAVVQQWYKRRFSLDPFIGKTVSKYDLVCENEIAGTYVIYFKRIRIINAITGAVKKTIWNGGSVPTNAVDTRSSVSETYTLAVSAGVSRIAGI